MSVIWLAVATAVYLLHLRIRTRLTLLTLWSMWFWTLLYVYETGLSRPGFGHGPREWIARKQTLDAYADAALIASMALASYFLVTASRKLARSRRRS